MISAVVLCVLTSMAAQHTLLVTAEPGRARVTVMQGETRLKRALTPVRVTLSEPGELTLHVHKEEHKTETRTVQVEQKTRTHFCMDPHGQLVDCLRTFRTGYRPKALALRPNGDASEQEVWVTLFKGPPAVQIYNLSTGKRIKSLVLGDEGAVELTFTRDGARAYVSQLDAGLVYEIDAEKKKVLRKMRTRSKWPKVVALSPDEKTLFTSNWRGNSVSEIDLLTGKVRRVHKTTPVPRGLLPTADGRVFVAGYYRGAIDVIDLATGKVKTVHKGGHSLRHLAGNASRFFASDMGADKILRFDVGEDGQLTSSLLARTDSHPNTISVRSDGQVVFVSTRGRTDGESWLKPGPYWGTVLLIDADGGDVLDAIVAGNQPTGLTLSADGNMLVTSDFLDDRVHVFAVPPTDVLRAGGGGRKHRYRKELKKSDEQRQKEVELRARIRKIRERRLAREAARHSRKKH